jgi:hypothetical protein
MKPTSTCQQNYTAFSNKVLLQNLFKWQKTILLCHIVLFSLLSQDTAYS